MHESDKQGVALVLDNKQEFAAFGQILHDNSREVTPLLVHRFEQATLEKPIDPGPVGSGSYGPYPDSKDRQNQWKPEAEFEIMTDDAPWVLEKLHLFAESKPITILKPLDRVEYDKRRGVAGNLCKALGGLSYSGRST